MADDTTDTQDQRDADTTTTDDKPLGAAGEKALEAEREARREADKRAKAAEKELADLKAEAQKRADAEAAEQGKWKELAEKRDADLTTVTTDRDTIKAEADTLRKYVTDDIAGVTKQVKDLKDNPSAKALLSFHPGDDASVTQLLDWAAKAKALLPDLVEETRPTTTGNGPNPKPATGTFNRDAAIEKARQSGRFRI